jgi:hypothetical protein
MSATMDSAPVTSGNLLAMALSYVSRGWPIFPLAPGQKTPVTKHGHLDATIDQSEITLWWSRCPKANIGLVTGKQSGIVVLDVDPRHGGDESLRTLQKEYGHLPETVMAFTGGGGVHYLFKYPDNTEIGSSAGVVGVGLDVKADRGYVVAPPSLHQNGRTYIWDDVHHPDSIPLAQIPNWLLARMQTKPVKGPIKLFVAPEKILGGQRNSTLYREARSLRAKGLSPQAIAAAIRKENEIKCSPPLDPKEVETIIRQATTQLDRPEFKLRSGIDTISALRRMSPEVVKASWINLTDGLGAIGAQELMSEVNRLTGTGIQTLKRALFEHRANLKNEASALQVGRRLIIDYHPEDIAAMAYRVEKEILTRVNDFELINFGGVPARVVVQTLPLAHQADSDRPPLPTAQIDILNKPKLLPLVERAVVFQRRTKDNTCVNIAVPEKVLDHLLVNSTNLPKVSALVTHPVVTMSGRIVSGIGIDKETGLLLHGSELEELRPYSKPEAQAGLEEIVTIFTNGFEFETALDRACAIGMLFTGLERKLLSMAPGALVTAAQQSVGKTTLVRRTHVILTSFDMPVMTWPEEDETATNKLIFSAMLTSPPLICFDNVGDGLTFKSAAIAAAMTGPIKEERILGVSRVAKAPTNILFVLTGNNIGLSNDEVHRWMRIRLKSSDVSPHKRRFQHPDVVGHGLEIRDKVIRHAIGILAGYFQSTERIPPSSRFPQWDALVRQPLMWAGLEDIGKAFDQNIDFSPELGALRALLAALSRLFGNKEFGVRDLIKVAGFEDPPVVNEALRVLHAKDTENERSVGHALSKKCGRKVIVEVEGSQRFLTLQSRLVTGLTRYRVEEDMSMGDLVG